MQAALLYSGGKDSSLVAYLLDKMGFEVKLVTVTFGINDGWKYAKESANALGFDHGVMELGKGVLDDALNIIKRDGFPKNAITYIHKKALEVAAQSHRVLADGTRRDDRAPALSFPEIRALEDRFSVEYINPLRGLGYKTINRLCESLFVVEAGESSKINKGDYEGELKTYLKNKGFNIEKIFPTHQQTRVISWRSKDV